MRINLFGSQKTNVDRLRPKMSDGAGGQFSANVDEPKMAQGPDFL